MRSGRRPLPLAATRIVFCFSGLLGISVLCWLAYLATGPSWKTTRIDPVFKWFWFVPLPYMAAWLALTCRSFADAAVRAVLLAGANLFITGLGLALGTSLLGLLAVPTILVGYCVLGLALGFAEAFPDFEGTRDLMFRHASGFVLASFAVYASPFLMLEGGEPISNEAAYRTAGALALDFSLHAIATLPQIASSAKHPYAVARVAVLPVLVLVVPIWTVPVRSPGSEGLWWPLRFRKTTEVAHPSRDPDPFRSFRLDPAAERTWGAATRAQ